MFCDITESDIDKILESLESMKEKVKNLTDRVEKLENMPPKEYFECKHTIRPLSDHDRVYFALYNNYDFRVRVITFLSRFQV